jgi:two-component system cell cycle sensor histidine kinase/response regulator CckA
MLFEAVNGRFHDRRDHHELLEVEESDPAGAGRRRRVRSTEMSSLVEEDRGGALRVLLVEDSESEAKLVLRELARLGRPIESERVETAKAMREALERSAWDVVLSDWSMPSFSGPAALALMKGMGLDLPFIIVSGTVGEEAAVDTMRAGARDFVLKGKLARLSPAIEREVREHKLREAHRRSEAALSKSQELLRQAQKMESLGMLAGGVAHDFNNMLSIIQGYSEMVLGDLDPLSPIRRDMEEIRAATKRAADLTRQLLTFSRQQVLEPRVVDLNDVLKTLDTMLQRILGEDVTLVTLLASKATTVRIDPTGLGQIVMNLVVNARDAMPTGGKLTVETANVVLDASYAASHIGVTAGPHVVLTVRDTGTGMDAQTLARIFEPFFTTKETGKGTGLGLSTVFGVVQQSGGSIEVTSAAGEGTMFQVFLPYVDDDVDLTEPTRAPTTLRASETILLVDDDKAVRAVAARILKRGGYNVIEARSGDEALLIAASHASEIHLLLSDVVMPDMGGVELARRLAAVLPTVKMLCMSGYTADTILRHGVEEATMAYVQKPFTPDSLTTKVREVLDSGGPTSGQLPGSKTMHGKTTRS